MIIQKTAERYSFNHLISANSFRIEIPIIQRDYAQGRDSQKEVRDNFLKALYNYLEEGLPNRDLDFIYGYITKDKNFVPLDGQQRLTTLFLLHWYLAKINNDEIFIKNILSADGKSKFVYKTRFSSTDFCEAILNNEINLNELKDPDLNKKNALSKTIINKGWFQKYWSSDATVLSMLTMLDDIHYLFRDKPQFYNSLIAEQPIITFLFLNLEDLNQGDDLYIKMNSRGKPLTNFENFKARFESEISLILSNNKEYNLDIANKVIKCTPQEYFSYKIDCVWTDLFWNYRDLVGDINTYDDELMNFIRTSLTFSYIKNNSFDKSILDLLLSNQTISFNKQKELNLFTEDSIKFLINTFDSLMNGNLKPSNKVINEFYFNFEVVFTNVLKNTASIPDRILYYSYVNYIIKFSNDILGLQDWMRVIANLVENTRFDSQDQFYSAIQSINKMIESAPSILVALSNNLKVDFFFTEQVYEEKIKAKAILSDRGSEDSWEKEIYNAESAIFHKGQIGYLFEFSDIQNLEELNERLIYSKPLFKNYLKKSKALFSILEHDANRDFLLERALLTFGNYLVKASNWRYNLSSSKKVANYDRDYSWKRILRVDFNSLAEDKGKIKRATFKNLFDDKKFLFDSEMIVKESLNRIIKQSNVNDWRKDFINDPKIIKHCGQGYIYDWSENHKSIQLLNASQMNHLRYDLNTLVLFYMLDNLENHKPFNQFWIEPAKGYENETFIILSDWCHKRIYYKVLIKYTDEEYYLSFIKSKGINKPDEYGEDIRVLLKKLNYNWEENEYNNKSSSKDEVLNKYKNLLKSLSQLKDK